ncbi:MAG TPA: NmrA family NAD(P)-binding protein [Caldilineae bacterium]|nr:NmrA family NAD(P)-binding protein [Caldilineae bacterium]
MNKRILVLGGTGMLGLPVARSLVRAGNQVRVLARNVERRAECWGQK